MFKYLDPDPHFKARSGSRGQTECGSGIATLPYGIMVVCTLTFFVAFFFLVGIFFFLFSFSLPNILVAVLSVAGCSQCGFGFVLWLGVLSVAGCSKLDCVVDI
jgi:hypothetical protein